MGSSPRLRGARRRGRFSRRTRRLIPASAGSTVSPGGDHGNRAAHPRVCGEHASRAHSVRARFGSSPRLRGARKGWRPLCGGLRLIPASAGSTAGWLMPRSGWWAHPRVCGEHCALQGACLGELGSSPRLRGALSRVKARLDDARLIPASAGSTLADKHFRQG